VLLAESDALGHGLAEAQADAVLALAGNYDAILVPATSGGKNFAPRVAAKLDVAPISEIVEVVSADTFTRPIYAGNALETVQTSDAKKVITVRPTAFAAAEEGGSASVETVGGADAARPASSAKRWSSRTVRNWPRPRSSSRAVAPWARPRSSRR
jgi:electron transfer flavoprotein alpha subunit